MNSVEETLKRMTPREPSRDYVERGLSRLTAGLPGRSQETRRWRFAAIVLAVMLTSSVTVNALMWSKHSAADRADAMPPIDRIGSGQSPAEYVAYSVFRPEGDLLVHEVRFGTVDEAEPDND